MALSPPSCSSCGAANRAQSAFCHRCGKPLTGGGPPRTERAPAPSIEVSTNTNTQRKSYSLRPDKQKISIGRAPSNDIVIDEMVVSGFHLQIRQDGGQLVTWLTLACPTRPTCTSTSPISLTFIAPWSRPTPSRIFPKRPRPVSSNRHSSSNMWRCRPVRCRLHSLEQERASHHEAIRGNNSDYSQHATWNC